MADSMTSGRHAGRPWHQTTLVSASSRKSPPIPCIKTIKRHALSATGALGKLLWSCALDMLGAALRNQTNAGIVSTNCLCYNYRSFYEGSDPSGQSGRDVRQIAPVTFVFSDNRERVHAYPV